MKSRILSSTLLATLIIVITSCQPKSTLITDMIRADSSTAIVQPWSGKVAGYIDNGQNLNVWTPDINDGATMFFDNTCEVRLNYDKELMRFITQ